MPKIAVDEIAFAGNDAAPDAFAFLVCRREDAYGFTMVKGEPLLVEPARRRIVQVIE